MIDERLLGCHACGFFGCRQGVPRLVGPFRWPFQGARHLLRWCTIRSWSSTISPRRLGLGRWVCLLGEENRRPRAQTAREPDHAAFRARLGAEDITERKAPRKVSYHVDAEAEPLGLSGLFPDACEAHGARAWLWLGARLGGLLVVRRGAMEVRITRREWPRRPRCWIFLRVSRFRQMARLAQLSGTENVADSLHLTVRSKSLSSLRG